MDPAHGTLFSIGGNVHTSWRYGHVFEYLNQKDFYGNLSPCPYVPSKRRMFLNTMFSLSYESILK